MKECFPGSSGRGACTVSPSPGAHLCCMYSTFPAESQENKRCPEDAGRGVGWGDVRMLVCCLPLLVLPAVIGDRQTFLSEENGGTDSFWRTLRNPERDLEFGLRQSQAGAEVSLPRTLPESGCSAILLIFLLCHTTSSKLYFCLPNPITCGLSWGSLIATASFFLTPSAL